MKITLKKPGQEEGIARSLRVTRKALFSQNFRTQALYQGAFTKKLSFLTLFL